MLGGSLAGTAGPGPLWTPGCANRQGKNDSFSPGSATTSTLRSQRLGWLRGDENGYGARMNDHDLPGSPGVPSARRNAQPRRGYTGTPASTSLSPPRGARRARRRGSPQTPVGSTRKEDPTEARGPGEAGKGARSAPRSRPGGHHRPHTREAAEGRRQIREALNILIYIYILIY